jgi:hypothetical protein
MLLANARAGRGVGEIAPKRIGAAPEGAAPIAVPVKVRLAETMRLLPRHKGIYHVGWTDYPDPTYP